MAANTPFLTLIDMKLLVADIGAALSAAISLQSDAKSSWFYRHKGKLASFYFASMCPQKRNEFRVLGSWAL